MPESRSSSPIHVRSLMKDVFRSRKLYPLLSGTFCFALFLLAFILIPYFQKTPAFLSDEVTLLSVFHDKFARADLSSYTFHSGLGISLFQLMLTGFGGILDLPGSLLPETIHLQTALFLSALRLGLSAFFFGMFLLNYLKKTSLLRVFGMTLLYTIGAFFLSWLTGLPIAGTYILFPIVLHLFTGVLFHTRPVVSSALFLAFAAYYISNLPLALMLLPVLVFVTFLLCGHFRQEKRKTFLLRFSSQAILAFCLCGILLVPQVCKLYTLFSQTDPTAVFLQKLGSDNSPKKTDVTFTCPHTSVLLENPATIVLADSGAVEFESSSSAENQFNLLNEWTYSLWPSLPAKPFQNISSELPTPVYVDNTTVEFQMTTLFIEPLYAAIALPHLDSDVQVYLDSNPIQVLHYNSGTILVTLGTYNVGQLLTLRLTSSDPGSIREAKVCFAYLDTYDWSKYTDGANFGIPYRELRSDGLYAEALAASDSLLLTNIPFDSGWELYLNGQRADTFAYENAWVSRKITPGSHTIFLRYNAPGKLGGSLLSGISLLLLAAYYFSKSSPKKSQSKESRNK